MRSVKEEAARWFVRMCGAAHDDPERGRFEAWLSASQAHARAYAAISDVWSDLATAGSSTALAQAMRDRQQRTRLSRRRLLKATAVGALVIGLGAGWLDYHWHIQPVWSLHRQTSTGEFARETLPDGSTISMSAATCVSITYTRRDRDVALGCGEAVFEVTRDASRRFVVDSGRLRVTVLGTRFAVARFSDKIRVSVDHGHVQLTAGPFWRRRSLTLTNGQVAELDWSQPGAAQLRVVAVSPEGAFTFAQGFLSLDGADLEEVAETLTRYRHGAVRVVPGMTRLPHDLRVTAGVPVGAVETFIDLLPGIAAVDVVRRGEDVDLSPR